MEHITYMRTHFAGLLKIDEAKLFELDQQFNKIGTDGIPTQTYTPRDLSLYRSKLGVYPANLKVHRQLFLNFKGGTGKTSISISYAYNLAERGYKVLMVDLDSQGHAAKCLGFEAEHFEKTLYDILIKKVPIQDVIMISPLQELHFIPSNLKMSTIDLALMPMHAREFRLQKAYESILDNYDFIIMDAPPSFGLLNLNALMATDDLLVPVLADFLSFHGLRLLFDTITGLQQDLQLTLDQVFIVLNNYNPTTRIAREAKEALEKHYPDFLLSTVVRQCTKFAQASSEGQPITAFDPQSKASDDISALIAEVFSRTHSCAVVASTQVPQQSENFPSMQELDSIPDTRLQAPSV